MKHRVSQFVVTIVWLAAGLSACSEKPAAGPIFDTLPGIWEIREFDILCENGGMQISFVRNNTRMVTRYQQRILAHDGRMISHANHDIRAFTDNSISYESEGESRTFRGELISWRVVLDTPDSFHWEIIEAKRALPDERDQWWFGPVERCPESLSKIN